jgi:hypothetical protein
VDESDAWGRWWAIEGLFTVRGLLWDRWDPLALRYVAPDDEYDDELNELGRKLRQGESAAGLASWLSCTEREYMARGHEARSSEDLLPIAELLVNWYQHADRGSLRKWRTGR